MPDPDDVGNTDSDPLGDVHPPDQAPGPASGFGATHPDAGLAAVAADERLDSRVVLYWLLTGALGYGVLAAIAWVGLTVFGKELPYLETVRIVGFSVLGVAALWALIAPALAYRRWRFRTTDELLTARYGIIFHEEKAIPISRLQHIDLTRGPVERLFGLATLVVFTAGTEGASFRLPGLAAARAQQLRDLILEARGDDVI